MPAYAANIAAEITFGADSRTTDAFSPNPINANVGDTVTWTNNDRQPHTVISGSNGQPDGNFDSSPRFNPLIAPQQTFGHRFEVAGEYPYYCALHPNMVGSVIVVLGDDNDGNLQDSTVAPMIFPIIVAAILAASVAGIIGYTRLKRKGKLH